MIGKDVVFFSMFLTVLLVTFPFSPLTGGFWPFALMMYAFYKPSVRIRVYSILTILILNIPSYLFSVYGKIAPLHAYILSDCGHPELIGPTWPLFQVLSFILFPIIEAVSICLEMHFVGKTGGFLKRRIKKLRF